MSDDYVYQLSISIPHSGSDYSKADMVNIRGRNPEEFHRALTAFNEHMSQQCVEVGAMLRAHTLLKDGLGAQQVSQERHEPAQQPQGSQVDPWTGAPANGAQNGAQTWQAPQGAASGPPDWAQQQQQQQQTPEAPQGGGVPTSPPPHVGPAPSCSHGVKKFLAKPYKNGKPGYWMAWACPAQRGDMSQHELEFIRTN